MYSHANPNTEADEASTHLLSPDTPPKYIHDETPDRDELDLLASLRRLRLWLYGVSSLLTCTLLAMALLMWHYGSGGDISAQQLGRHDFVPPMPSHIVTFERNELFSAPSTPEADQAWGSLSPPGDGFVIVPDARAYDLPPGKPSNAGEVYDISVFHQLHCLNHLRTFLFTLKAGMDLNNTREVYDRLLVKQEDHVYHCFDLIRQALMCHPDLTVEWPRTEVDGRRFAFDGWGIQHQCVDWNSVLGFMGKHTVANTEFQRRLYTRVGTRNPTSFTRTTETAFMAGYFAVVDRCCKVLVALTFVCATPVNLIDWTTQVRSRGIPECMVEDCKQPRHLWQEDSPPRSKYSY
ncbi:hypothetical protein LTR95_006565 [Oleoguttula sp. CCFEE 5521]